MGKSDTYGGPSPERTLLPDWALPDEPPPETSADADDQADNSSTTEDSSEDQAPTTEQDAAREQSARWQAARTSMTRFASGGGRRSGIQSAARGYVRARGGSRAAARSASSGRSAAAGLGHFLSTVATRGLRAGLDAIGLGELVGQSIEVVFTQVANALAPDGALREDVAARKAIDEALYQSLARFMNAGADASALEQMSKDDVVEAICECVSVCIYSRWLEELGLSIEKGAVTAAQAVRLERDVKQYVRECVRFETRDIDVLAVDWKGRPGRDLITRVFEDAYSLLGAGV